MAVESCAGAVTIKQTENTARRSTATSWLAVLALVLVIFGLIRGIVWLWGGENTYNVVYDWLEKRYYWYAWGYRGDGNTCRSSSR